MKKPGTWPAAFAIFLMLALGCSSSSTEDVSVPSPQATEAPVPTLPPLVPTPTPTPSGSPATVSPLATRGPGTSGEVTNRIVYVSPDSQIYTINPDGSDRIRLSPERGEIQPGEFTAGYTWPGWSPDGQSVLFSAALPPEANSPYVLMTTDADGSSAQVPHLLYQNEAGTGTIVPGGPHYGLWSPDSKKVASIVATRAGLATLISDTEELSTTPLVPGAPVYLGWSPDSTELLVHVSDSLYLFEAPFNAAPITLEGGNTMYFAPEYAPADNRAAYLISSDSGLTLNVHDRKSGDLTAIADVATFTAFRWAPDGESLAVLRGDPRAADSTLWAVAADGSSEELLATGRYEMMMWSPDGQKILLAEIDPTNTERSAWSVLDLSSGEIRQIVEFTPSGEIFQLQQFFDQYSSSHTFWSPDSESLVFAGLLHAPAPVGDDAARSADTVWVVSATGDSAPKAVAEGFLAFWSPR